MFLVADNTAHSEKREREKSKNLKFILDKEFRVEIYVFIYSLIPLGSCCNVNLKRFHF